VRRPARLVGVHIPFPFSALVDAARHTHRYFKTGVRVEGDAWLCDKEHILFGDPSGRASVPQHVDVELRFWLRRGQRATVLEVAAARIPQRGDLELVEAPWRSFSPVTVEGGGPPRPSMFSLVPRHNPKGRVEASVGDRLHLEFLPSTGSERWARPNIEVPLGVRDRSD
jgi:hypothetical protein